MNTSSSTFNIEEIHDSACRLGLKSSPTQERKTTSQEFASELQKFETRNKKEKTLSLGRLRDVGEEEGISLRTVLIRNNSFPSPLETKPA